MTCTVVAAPVPMCGRITYMACCVKGNWFAQSRRERESNVLNFLKLLRALSAALREPTS